MVHIGQHSAGDKIPLAVLRAFGLREYFCSFGQSVVDMFLNGPHLFPGRHGADIRHQTIAVADTKPLHPFLQYRQKFMVDFSIHVDSFHTAARLSRVLHARPDGAARSAVQIRILANDHRIVPTQLQHQGRQVFGGFLH